MGPVRRDERGTTLVELLMVLGLLVVFANAFYLPIILSLRGSALLRGQLEVQQQPRVAMERLINDLRQASDYAITTGPPLRLAITKVTALLCGAGAGAGTIIVGNATDLRVGDAVGVTAGAVGLEETGKTITAIGSGTCAGGASGGALTISPAVINAFPAGSVVSPVNPNVTYELNAAKQLLRNGAVLADNVDAVCFRDRRSTLAAAAGAGATSIAINSANGVCPNASASSFAVGDLIFIEFELRTVTAVAGTSLTLDLGLSQNHAAGAPVRRKLLTVVLTIRRAANSAGGNLVQQVTLTSNGGMRN